MVRNRPMQDQIWAILPVKSLSNAKQRLSGVLAASQRKELARNCLLDVLDALADSALLDGVAIVSGDREALAIAQMRGLRHIVMNIDSGQSAAVTHASRELRNSGIVKTVTVPGDVPLVTSGEIDQVCRSIDDTPSLTFVPNSDSTGTNSIATSLPGLIPYQFGDNSFARHRRSAQSIRIEYKILHLPYLGLDIDTEQDLAQLVRHPTRTRSQEFLDRKQSSLRQIEHRMESLYSTRMPGQ